MISIFGKFSPLIFALAFLFLIIMAKYSTVSAAQLTVRWADTSNNETGFKIERKTGTWGAFAQVGTTGMDGTTFISTNLAASTAYCYRVRAYNSAGDSAYSNEACGTTSAAPFTLTVTTTGSGTVNSTPVGISCGADCSESYISTTSVTLSAAPTSGSIFSGWSGSGCSGTGVCTLLMNTDTNVTAAFVTVAPPSTNTIGLVAAYSFNEGEGITVEDSSGNGNTGTLYEAAWRTGGKYGASLSFDGANDLVTIKDKATLDLTTGMTLEAWIYPTALSGGEPDGFRTVILKEMPGDSPYGLYANTNLNKPSGYVMFTVDSPRSAYGTTQLQLYTWTHLATTFDRTTIRLYINGIQVSATAVSGSTLTSNGRLSIGGNAVWGEYFQGRIDEVRVYNRALTASEIQRDMSTAIAP